MSHKPKPEWDDPEESKRFLETAKEIGASDRPADFERVFKKIVLNDKPKKSH